MNHMKIGITAIVLLFSTKIAHAEKYVAVQFLKNETDAMSDYCYHIGSLSNDLSCDDKSNGTRFAFGYAGDSGVGVEFGYVNFGEYGVKESNSTWYHKEVAKAKAYEIAVVGRAKLSPSVNLIGRLGLDAWDVERTSKGWLINYGSSSHSTSAKGMSPRFGAGLEFSWFTIALDRINKVGDEEKTGEGNVTSYSLGMKISF